MGEAIADGSLRVRGLVRSVHGLKEKVSEAQTFESIRLCARLRVDELEIVTLGED
ncbi:hypothetical protein PSN01_04092 [Micromonospora saelicesensis]|nr:hypothetical protein PSN01_04092 [Micromonospora saelicesensis]